MGHLLESFKLVRDLYSLYDESLKNTCVFLVSTGNFERDSRSIDKKPRRMGMLTGFIFETAQAIFVLGHSDSDKESWTIIGKPKKDANIIWEQYLLDSIVPQES